jgi:formamidopyrimidine-DNA glycosylase
MPELPETETIARDLDAALRQATVRRVEVLRPDVLRAPAAKRAPARYAARNLNRIVTQPIARVFRRAKAIVLEFSHGDRLVVVPRFTGALLLGARAHRPYACLTFTLDGGRHLEYVDVRRLGTVSLLTPAEYATWDARLGAEPLDPTLTAEQFSSILRGSSRAAKTVLMDQRRLAGIGNIYANEALWHAGLRPTRRASTVTRAESARLLESLRNVLTASIALRGTTFRDFQDAYGGRGGYARELKVYGRGDEPCARCGARLHETHKLEGRSTVWCRACQR